MASSSVVGSLRVNLGLDSAQFTKGIQGANRHVADMRKRFLAVAATAAAVGGALTALTVKTAQTAAEIQRFSQVANAAPEELQKWAAGSASVGIQQEKLADILKDVNDRVGDFLTTGGGPMADFFEKVAPKIGLTADAFRDLSGPQALQLYVSSLEKAGLSQQEMTFYLEAMASDATSLIPLLKNGGAEMARLGENAKSLGGIMQDGTVKSLGALKLAMLDAGTAIQGVGYRISGELAPALTTLTQSFANSMREGGLLRGVVDALIGGLDRIAAYAAAAAIGFGVQYVSALALAAGATGTLSAALVLLKGAILRTGIGILVVGAGELVYWLGRVVSATGSVTEALTRVYNVGKATLLGVGNTAWGLTEIMAGVASSIVGSFVAAFALIAKSFDDLLNGMSDAWNALAGSGLGDMMGLGTLGRSDVSGSISSVADGLFDQAVTSIKTGGKRIADAGNGVAAALAASVQPLSVVVGGMDEGSEAADRLASALDGVADSSTGGGSGSGGVSGSGGAAAVGKVTEAVDTLKQRMEATKDTMRNAFAGLVTGAKSLKATLADLLSSFATFAANKLFDNLFSATSSGGGIGGLVSGLLGGIPAYATGTNNHKGGLARINEQGGEIVNLPNGSQVIPHDISKRITNGGGGNQNFHVTVGIDDKGALQAYVSKAGVQAAQAGASQAVGQVKQNLSGWSAQLQRDGALA